MIPYSSVQTPDKWLSILLRLFSDEQYSTIILITDLILQIWSTNDFWMVRGQSFQEIGENEAALYCFDQIESSFPSLSIYRGISLQNLKRYEEAVSEYEKITEEAFKYYNLACCYCLMGQIDTSLDYIELAIQEDADCKSDFMRDNDVNILKNHPRFMKLINPPL